MMKSRTKWRKQSFDELSSDFSKVCDDMTGGQSRTIWNENYRKLKQLYNVSQLSNLNSSLWKRLENCESKNNKTLTQISQKFPNQNVYDLISEVVTVTAAPVILSFRDSFSLLTRDEILMISKFLHIEPRVVIVKWR